MNRLLAGIAATVLTATQAAEVIHSLDSVEGVALTWGTKTAPHRAETVTGEGLTTEGQGALRLAWTSGVADGNQYCGVMIRLPRAVDLRDTALTVDAMSRTPKAEAFYLRAYNAGETAPAWSFSSWGGLLTAEWRTFRFQTGFSPDGLDWEPGVVAGRVPTTVDRIEVVIGTHESRTEIEAILDRVCLAERVGTIDGLMQAVPLHPETPLVRAGKAACVVLHPASAEGARAAAQIAEAVRARSGVALPTRPGTREDAQPAENTIMLGTVDTNPAIVLLYARGLTPVDSVCPGRAGALVHSLCDPFGKGANVVVAGAADSEGLAKSTALLVAAITALPAAQDFTLPRVFERSYGADFLSTYGWADDEPAPDRLAKGLEEGQRVLDQGQHTSIAGLLKSVANRYRFTGHGVEARLFVKLWDLYAASAKADPRKFGGAWGFDSDFPSREVVSGWDVLEEDPGLTDAERLQTLKAMGRWVREAVVPECASAARSQHLLNNHQTFPSLGCLFAGLYLTQHYRTVEGELWLKLADQAFRNQSRYYKPHEDCNGYQWLTNSHVLTYAVARPDLTVFDNGNAARIIDFCIGNMDNLGYQVPYGDTGSWACWNSEMICLDLMAFVTGSPEALWAANYKRQVKGTRPEAGSFFQLGSAPVPTRYNGVHVWPLEPHYYASQGGENRPPLAQCFDKISFRESMDPQGLYVLLDGLSNGGHKHLDGHSIPRITWYDRIWLADNDYFKAPLKFHNSMMVIRDGESAAIPPYAERVGAGESGNVGYCRTRLTNYVGTDWERTLVWLKADRALVVLDRLTAQKAGEYQFRLLWHGMGQAELRPEGLRLTQRGPGLWIQVAPGPRHDLQDDEELGANWKGYAHAEPVVRSLSSVASVHLDPTESYLFATVFHGTPEGPGDAWRMDLVDGLPALVLGTSAGPAAVGLGRVDMTTPDGRFETDADVVVGSGRGLSLLGVTRATLDQRPLYESGGRPSSVDLTDVDVSGAVAGLPVATRAPAAAPVSGLPQLPVVWTASPRPESAVLTGNRGLTGAVAGFATVTSETAPAARNAFAPEAANAVAALTDGTWAGTVDSVMYAPDQPVTLRIAFGATAAVRRVTWHQWWAKTSSKNTAYLLAKATLQASNDGFAQDVRTVGALADVGAHPDWGSPVAFEMDAAGTEARELRLLLGPQSGSAIYLGEIIVVGPPPAGAETLGAYAMTAVTVARLQPDVPSLVLTTHQGDLIALTADGKPV